MKWYMWYILIYTFFSVGYIWYRYVLLITGEQKKYSDWKVAVSVVIPFYNEDIANLRATINSLKESEVDKEIIFIDDGSKDVTPFNQLKSEFNDVIFIRSEKNIGKREAQALGFKIAKHDILVTVDSDTIIDKDAIARLIAPLQDEKIGCVTGNVLITNTNESWITKLQAVTYWLGLSINKQGLSNHGIVTCCSGCLSAYRKNYVLSILDTYLGQTFLGQRCTYGDDRHLTNLFLKEGYKVLYIKEAKSYTEVPNTFYKYVRQQIRWKRSFWRESFFVLKNVNNWMIKNEVITTIATILFSTLIKVMSFIGLFWSAITMNWFYFGFFLVSMILFTTLRNFLLLAEDWKLFLRVFPTALLYDFVLYWLNIYALFTLSNKGWTTR